MGDTPEPIEIACPGCDTQFRLRPKKGRLPKGPVPCPKCAERIPIVDKNILAHDSSGVDDSGAAGSGVVQAKSATSNGESTTQAPTNSRLTPGRADPNPAGPPSADDNDQDAGPVDTDSLDTDSVDADSISAAMGLSEADPKSTFLGMGSALAAIESSANKDTHDKTAVVDKDVLAKIRNESSAVEDDDEDPDDATPAEPTLGTQLGDTTGRDVHLRETSENLAISADDDPNRPNTTPGQMVLGKINIKKKLKRRPNADANTDASPKEKSGKKPSLSALLKRARRRRDDADPSKPDAPPDTPLDSPQDSGADKTSSDDFDRALDKLADETAQAIGDDDDADPGADTTEQPAFDTGDSSMIELLRRRVAENQQPGAASERRGSGYIRLPTAEIQDVLGQGTYRLRVEDIVYEPIDKAGLTQLVKRGVLLGAAEIADSDGQWMPVAEHPVFEELRRKMAREAHDLLSDYGGKADQDASETAELPQPKPDLPTPASAGPPPEHAFDKIADQTADTPDGPATKPHNSVPDIDGIPTLDAAQEEEAKKAAKALFADHDVQGQAPTDPPAVAESSRPTPAASSSPQAATPSDPADAERAAQSAPSAAAPAVTSVPASEPASPQRPRPTSDGTVSDGSKLRLWIPLVAAFIVVAALALSPFGRPYLGRLMSTESSDTAPSAVGPDHPGPDHPGADDAAVGESIATATQIVDRAADNDPSDPANQRRVVNDLIATGRPGDASVIMGAMWPHHRKDPAFVVQFGRQLIAAGRFERAVEIAVQGIQLDAPDQQFEALVDQAITQNPDLGDTDPVDIDADAVDRASPRRHGDRLVFELSNQDDHVFTFKPAQDTSPRGWRNDVAAWRLCQMLVCGFVVPRTRSVRIEKSTLKKWVPAAERSAQPWSTLAWAGDDDQVYVVGSLQDAVARPARFPIESTDVWRSWLNGTTTLPTGSSALADALAPVDELPNTSADAILAALDDSTLPELAAQLSSVLVVDFLTNNWDRFAADKPDWGKNLHVSANHLVSLHNGTTFHGRASTRVRGRFRWTSRVSRDLITSLRAMDPEVASAKLFPNPSAAERAKLEVFRRQRARVLERVDELDSSGGAKDGLAFP